MRPTAVLPLSLVFALGSGCDAFDATVSATRLEALITEAARGDEPSNAQCPDNQPLKRDHTFTCTITLSGTPVEQTVRVTDPEKGTMVWSSTYAVFKHESLEGLLNTKDFPERDLEIHCADKVIVSTPDSIWVCSATDKREGARWKVTVMFTDGAGGYKAELAPEST